MLHILISLITVSSRVTISQMRMSLYALNAKMAEMNSDISKFNEYVNGLLHDFESHDQRTEELLNLLFVAYLSAKDPVFVAYIAGKEEKYEDGTLTITHQELMISADAKFKSMVEKGVWQKPTEETKQIIALTAQLETLKASALSKASTGKSVETSDKKRRAKTDKGADPYKWKEEEPKDGETTKVFRGKEYVYCPNHVGLYWVLAKGHKDGCTLDPANKKAPDKKASNVSKGNSKKLQYAKALVGVMEDDEDDGDYEMEDENI
jgi:hypothetical protein